MQSNPNTLLPLTMSPHATSTQFLSTSRCTFTPWPAYASAQFLFGEEIVPKIQLEPSLAQLEAIISCPVVGYAGEEANPRLIITSLQEREGAISSPLSLFLSRLVDALQPFASLPTPIIIPLSSSLAFHHCIS